MIFDITGGILTTLGLAFAGVSFGMQKRKIVGAYNSEIAKGRQLLEGEVSEKLSQYIGTIKERIDQNFHQFDDMIVQEEKQIETLSDHHKQIDRQLDALKQELPQA